MPCHHHQVEMELLERRAVSLLERDDLGLSDMLGLGHVEDLERL